MTNFGTFGDLYVTIGDDFVATAEIRRPPNNFFDLDLIESMASALGALDDDARCRAVVLCSEGKHFCAGANFAGGGSMPEAPPRNPDGSPRHLYDAAVDLFSTRTPVVAAIQGAAIGGGLGVAAFSDFRVAAPEARFAANFARLGFHHGFGLTATLPHLVGQQRALELLYTGRRISGEDAFEIGLVDRLVPIDRLRDEAHEFAAEIAASAPLAVASIRQTMRGDLAARVRAATDREKAEQDWLRATDDWREGVAAMAERRTPDFKAR
ncbi:MAG: enoyl-CoA hydratase/isomerase family protein [Actinomycetia bacterium]|nr:enoyl-CoA hydratase/isomerase family protein [Actinomycetes bacterium]MCP4957941.1 enoyl-CoA hydratase/isomerase family protein [Actinomycetes bacterium]